MKKTLLLIVLLAAPRLFATTTINPTNRFAYGANLGWMDWRGDTNNGAVIGEYVCSGYIYSANVGWINLGSGSPTNHIYYQNLSAGDFGVNQDGLGNLRGYAYAANIGWVNFENTGAPKVILATGKMSGYAYSANCGWISLSNASAFVQTDVIAPGADLNGDGIPDAWEYQNFGTTNINVTGDPDGDGASNKQEYLAGTVPTDPASVLKITAYSTTPGGTAPNLTWNSVLTRSYFIEKNFNIATTNWFDSSLGLITPDGASTTRAFADTNFPVRFYRVKAVRPLGP